MKRKHPIATPVPADRLPHFVADARSHLASDVIAVLRSNGTVFLVATSRATTSIALNDAHV